MGEMEPTNDQLSDQASLAEVFYRFLSQDHGSWESAEYQTKKKTKSLKIWDLVTARRSAIQEHRYLSLTELFGHCENSTAIGELQTEEAKTQFYHQLGAVDDVLQKALSVDRNARYPSVEEFVADLRRVLAALDPKHYAMLAEKIRHIDNVSE